jgi:hypothetical protein
LIYQALAAIGLENKLTKVKVTEVSYKGDSNFNLFAVGRWLVDRWTLSGDTDHITVLKDSMVIKFNIVIRTRNGALLCCMMKHSLSLETAADLTPLVESR